MNKCAFLIGTMLVLAIPLNAQVPKVVMAENVTSTE
jgi:hypothetical protein